MKLENLPNVVAKMHARLAAQEMLLLALFDEATDQSTIRRAVERWAERTNDEAQEQTKMQMLSDDFPGEERAQLERQREAAAWLVGKLDLRRK